MRSLNHTISNVVRKVQQACGRVSGGMVGEIAGAPGIERIEVEGVVRF